MLKTYALLEHLVPLIGCLEGELLWNGTTIRTCIALHCRQIDDVSHCIKQIKEVLSQNNSTNTKNESKSESTHKLLTHRINGGGINIIIKHNNKWQDAIRSGRDQHIVGKIKKGSRDRAGDHVVTDWEEKLQKTMKTKLKNTKSAARRNRETVIELHHICW